MISPSYSRPPNGAPDLALADRAAAAVRAVPHLARTALVATITDNTIEVIGTAEGVADEIAIALAKAGFQIVRA